MAQGGKQKTENIFRTQTADCFSGGQSFNPSYITCAVQIFRVEETRKWYRQQQSFGFFFLIISIFPNLIQLFVSSWSDFAQEGATITDRLWNCTTTHIHAHNQFFFFFFYQILFTCYSARFSMSLLFLPLLVFNFFVLGDAAQTQMSQTKRSFQCIKSEIQSLVAMCAPCPLPRLNICVCNPMMGGSAQKDRTVPLSLSSSLLSSS